MEEIREVFGNYPAQERVALMLLRLGVSVRDGMAYCGGIQQSDLAIARAAGVDRRVVRSALERISASEVLNGMFGKLQSMLLLADVASDLGCSAIEVVPTDATMPGILAEITNAIYRMGISVRQAVVDDPGNNRTDSHLIIVTEGEVPPELLTAIRQCNGVSSVTIR